MDRLKCKISVVPPCNKCSAPAFGFKWVKIEIWSQVLCCLYPKAICEYLLFAVSFLSPYRVVREEYSVLSKLN